MPSWRQDDFGGQRPSGLSVICFLDLCFFDTRLRDRHLTLILPVVPHSPFSFFSRTRREAPLEAIVSRAGEHDSRIRSKPIIALHRLTSQLRESTWTPQRLFRGDLEGLNAHSIATPSSSTLSDHSSTTFTESSRAQHSQPRPTGVSHCTSLRYSKHATEFLSGPVAQQGLFEYHERTDDCNCGGNARCRLVPRQSETQRA